MAVLVVNTTTIDDIANWAAVGKMKRFDILPDAREAAVDFYRLVCQKIPFDSLRITSREYSCIANSASYDLQAVLLAGGDPKLAGICSLRFQYSSGKFRRLRRSHARVYDALGTKTYTIPATYARWGGMIEFDPGPSLASQSFRLRYWTCPDINTTSPGNTVLQTPPEWDELFKWEVYYRMLIHTDQFEKAQQLVNPVPMQRQQAPKKTTMFETAIIPRLWNDLLLTVDQRENVDEDFGINPLIRAITRS